MEREQKRGVSEFSTSQGDRLSPDFLERLALIPRGEPLTWGATPLDTFYDSVLSQQANVQKRLYAQAKRAPRGTPDSVRKYVADTFLSRFNGRQMANFDNYNTALNKDLFESETDPRLREMYERGLSGYASPAELILIRQRTQMRSIELGCVSHSYGKHVKLLDGMRDAVKKTVELYDGTPTPRTRYSVKSFNLTSSQALGDAFLMTRKRDIAMLPDGTKIRERSSFIVRLDEASGFDQTLASAMREVKITDSETWQDDLRRVGHLDEVIPPLLATDNFDAAIPLSTTLYAYNKETEAAINAAEQGRAQEQWLEFQQNFPELANAIEESRRTLGAAALNPDAILYVGKEFQQDELE